MWLLWSAELYVRAAWWGLVCRAVSDDRLSLQALATKQASQACNSWQP